MTETVSASRPAAGFRTGHCGASDTATNVLNCLCRCWGLGKNNREILDVALHTGIVTTENGGTVRGVL